MTKKGTTALPEVPREQIIEAQKKYSQVRVDIRRQGSRGQWSQCGHWVVATSELLSLEDRLRRWGGGGQYRIQAMDPGDMSRDAVPPFMVNLEDPSTPWRDPDLAPEHGARSTGGMSAYMGADPFAAIRSQYPNVQRRMSPIPFAPPPQAEGKDGKGNKYASDEVAMMEVNRLSSALEAQYQENGNLRDRLDTMRQEHLAEIERIREEMRKLRDEMKDQQMAARDREMELRIEQTARANTGPDYASLLAAGAPIITAMLQQGSSSRSAAADSAARSQEATMALVTTLAKNDKGSMDGFVKVLPALIPMVQQFMEARGPKAQAEMIQMMADQVLTQTSMTAQVMQMAAENQPSDSPMAMMLQQLGHAMERGAEVLANQARDQQPRQQQPVDVRDTTAAMPPPPPQMPHQPGPAAPEEEPVIVDQEIVNLPVWGRVSRAFHTAEWGRIVFFIERGAPEGQLVEMLCGHLENLERVGTLPRELAGVMSDPELLKEHLLQHLDIAQSDAAYLDRLYARIEEELVGDQTVVEDPAQGDDEPTEAPKDEPMPTEEGCEDEPTDPRRAPVPAAAGG